ncbi:MAG: hypothetical protein NAG76_22405 [Candidatus Pristimantibacillus lignocellulolyticus]|uniref:Uncharacterized protein n=1 Tax=Candidatus Pristimantibacillus lignocellulolyticus TaxID=2994561 RepID=A0A9J6ZES4_9BACL|nr:MAG: hypothetical protein NAG76_22405 [Candidatus Pristimantibacillus lignocellulolyticus]
MKYLTVIANNDLLSKRILKGDSLRVAEQHEFTEQGAYIVYVNGELIVSDDENVIKNNFVRGKVKSIVITP